MEATARERRRHRKRIDRQAEQGGESLPMLSALFGRPSPAENGTGTPPAPSSGMTSSEVTSDQSVGETPDRQAAPPRPAPRTRRGPVARPMSISSAQSAAGCVGSAPTTGMLVDVQDTETAPSASTGLRTSLSSIQLAAAMTHPVHPLCPPSESHTMCGWIFKVETRPLLGVITRRKYWFALAEGSPYLYWFKERADVQCVGRISLSGAAFTFDPREKGKFIILSQNEEHVFEAGSNTLRDEWMRALQETRKRSWKMHIKIEKDIHALTTSLATTPSSPYEQSLLDLSSSSLDDTLAAENLQASSTTASVDDLFSELGPASTSSSDDTTFQEEENGDTTLRAAEEEVVVIGGQPQRTVTPPIAIPTSPSSTFYLTTDGSLNERSLEMPKEIVSAEAILHRLAERAGDGLERQKKVIDRARASFRSIRTRGDGETADKGAVAAESRVAELEELVELLDERAKTLGKALYSATRQLETTKKLSKLSRENEEQLAFVLNKEKELIDAQLRVNELQIRLQSVEEENRNLETTVSGLQADVEAFRESVRTKEELIMRLAEQSDEAEAKLNERRASFYGDVDVPEGILMEESSIFAVEDESRKIFEEQSVRDVHELRDLLEGYRHQNGALNNEIIELHKMVQAYDEKERKLVMDNFQIQACYYQLKSRYIMVLNHFKTPEKPGKIMEPGVLRELIDEANRTPRSAKKEKGKATDTLGFYLESKTGGDGPQVGDMFETAAYCQKKADEMVEASRLEQSEDYMKWLQSWDAFLVNSVNSRNGVTPSPELKTIVRTGVPVAYRARVWIRLVTMHVRERQAESGNGYFECMLRKAKKKKEEGVFDAAIKQIDLDLARTLPTNKFFEDPTSERVESLRRVLYAFRYHNAEVGYCQGLNRLAAIGLLYLSEEDAFWFLSACVDVLQPSGYYTNTLIGAVADQRVLRDLVQDKLPRLANHLKQLEVDLSLFTLSWFLTCFVDVLPHSVYLNIFDVFLYEGNKVLFRFALAVLKLGESRVIQCRTIGTVHACLSRAAEFVPDFKTLAQVAFNDLNPFPAKSIEQKRVLYLNQLKEQGYR